MLQVQHIKKVYGNSNVENAVVALNDVEFAIEKGEFVAVMGPSGSGKTTHSILLVVLIFRQRVKFL